MGTRAADSDISLISMALRDKAKGDRAIAPEATAIPNDGIAMLRRTLLEQASRAELLADALDNGELRIDLED